MPREANAVDFWRGIALITIFVNHIPGNFYGQYTHANYSISDSADLFVFMAGRARAPPGGGIGPRSCHALVSDAAARRTRGAAVRRADPDHHDRDRHAGGVRNRV